MNSRAIVGDTDTNSAKTASHIFRDKARTKIGCPSQQMLRARSASLLLVPPLAPGTGLDDNRPADVRADPLEEGEERRRDFGALLGAPRPSARATASELPPREVWTEITGHYGVYTVVC